MTARDSESTRAGLIILALAGGIFALTALASKPSKSRSRRKPKKTRTTKTTSKTKTFDGKGYHFKASHHYKADADKAAARLRKQGQAARVVSFRWSSSSKPVWGVFVR